MAEWPRSWRMLTDGRMFQSDNTDELGGDVVFYLRADTCTPNAELEKLIRDMKTEILNSYPNTRESEDVYAMQNWIEYRLREVMKCKS